WITMALCFLQVLREPVVQYLAGSEQRIAPFWNIITWYPTLLIFHHVPVRQWWNRKCRKFEPPNWRESEQDAAISV
ncbi:hypothetical protein, partial [Thiolapillus sp.]